MSRSGYAQGDLPATTTGQSASLGGASISGVIVDGTGAAIGKAQVTLVRVDGEDSRKTQSGEYGEFEFRDLPAGSFRLMVDAIGFASFKSDAIALTATEAYVGPQITLALARANTKVDVTSDYRKVAEEQIKAEEKQRYLGVLPAFYTSYLNGAVPMSAGQKYHLAIRSVFDPGTFVAAAAVAGALQATRTYRGYGLGSKGYAKRFGAVYGDSLTGTLFSYAVFPALLHQDPRYFVQGTGSVKSRAEHAIKAAFIRRTDNGTYQPNLSNILGDLAASGLSNLYYPHADRGVGLVFRNAVFATLGQAAQNLVREFIGKKITTDVPTTPASTGNGHVGH